MHFYESSIITTKDGLHCQVYGNEHPLHSILVKPKYVPTDKIESDALQYRFIAGKKMNRLNMWADKEKLKKYIAAFKKHYPQYVFSSPLHSSERLFFAVPLECIERIYFPRRGLYELMNMPEKSLDDHLRLVYSFANFLLKSGLKLRDLGVTYSTLMGHYLSAISDINIVVYGKRNFWRIMDYLKTAEHPLLKWKTKQDWLKFYKGRNRFAIFSEEEFLHLMSRKKSEGYFGGTLFVIFGTEKEEETWFKWGEEKYISLGLATVEGIVDDNASCVVRPGFYGIKESKVLEGKDVPVSKIVFYSRDYAMIAYPGEKIRACGILERVEPRRGKPYYRVVVGYFDAYVSERREKEFIKVIEGGW
jgi:predicted nucleotidyltransferase